MSEKGRHYKISSVYLKLWIDCYVGSFVFCYASWNSDLCFYFL